MSDELIERLRNPIGFAVLHTDAMAAIERIEKSESALQHWKQIATWLYHDINCDDPLCTVYEGVEAYERSIYAD